MANTLRQLLIERAARLQERAALTAPGWGTLSYSQLRNRIEGVALGLMAMPPPGRSVGTRTGTIWDWTCEVAAACCGLRWDPEAAPADPGILGGPRFNDEKGRRAYHECEEGIEATTPFLGVLSHGELLVRLQRLNARLGWDHETHMILPLSALPTGGGRAALWSALFAGAHAEVVAPGPEWDEAPFEGILSE